MQAVKKNVVFFLIIILGYSAHSQKINGEFRRTDPSIAAREIGVKFIFNEDFGFERTEFKHLGTQQKSHGSYQISEDTLTLNYEKYQEPFGNSIEIIKEKIKSVSESDIANLPLYSLIHVFEASGIPKSGVNLLLRSGDQEVVMAFMSDKEGFFPDLSIYDRYIEDFQISALGKQETVIDTDTLFGFRTRIKIIFEDSSKTKISKETTEKYLIKKSSDHKIELLSLDGDEFVVLKRVQKN